MTQELVNEMHFHISYKSSSNLKYFNGLSLAFECVPTQIGLELRYGREDEELMGLQFCNEMILASQSVYCSSEHQDDSLENLTDAAGCFLKHFKIGKIDHHTFCSDLVIPDGSDRDLVSSKMSPKNRHVTLLEYEIFQLDKIALALNYIDISRKTVF